MYVTDSFSSIDEMLDADTLGLLVGHEIQDVTRTSIQTEGFSENPMERVTCTRKRGTDLHFILKQFDPDNWLTKLAADKGLREISLLEKGWYAALPEPCSVPAVAATRHADGGSLLMWDISESLFPEGDSLITHDALEACIDAIASLHAHNWGRAPVADDLADLCSIQDWICLLSPDVGRNRVSLGVDNDVTAMLGDGWMTFSDVASDLAARTVSAVQSDPGALLQAFGSSSQTTIHGDVKLANLGIDAATNSVIMLDWGLVSYAPAMVELGWFLSVNSARLPTSKESVIDLYRSSLARHGVDLSSTWDRDLDLGLLAGGTLRLGWAKALGTLSDDDAIRTGEIGEVTERASRWLG
jgi:hypothetical protein